ncbi:hypothetical protein [Serinicoccus sp. CNJ-927]|uniref:hypothetical protein n=1 Tax=Serinicoccus sp. CNJ-927 TaxID=1904970 RepID=UPI001ED9CD43|nr:hypothetical protein [Serinicoccus sp. CNJ-927]
MVAGAIGAGVAGQALPGRTYSAEAELIVPMGQTDAVPAASSSTLPTEPYDATQLASSYAIILRSEAELIGELAEATSLSTAQVRDGLTATHLPSTRIIRVSFVAEDSDTVAQFFEALDGLLAESPSPHLPSGNLQFLSEPGQPTATTSMKMLAPWAGAAAGFILGLALALSLARSRDTRP